MYYFNYRSDPPVSPRHHTSVSERNSEPLPTTAINTPLASMMTLRETNIRDPPQQLLKEHCSTASFRNSMSFNNASLNSTTYLSRTVVGGNVERDCNLPFISSNVTSQVPMLTSQFSNLSSTGRESNSMLMRDGPSYSNMIHRLPSSRLLSNSIDQRILKQSTEDCRRLLQQVIPSTTIKNINHSTTNKQNKILIQATAIAESPRSMSHQQNSQMEISQMGSNCSTIHHPSQRVLTSSNSFDSKSNLPSFHNSYHMSSEASRLFNTLQQSPLPLTSANEVRSFFI